LSVLIAFASGVWLLVSLPWFFMEKRRPGQDPGKRSILVAGLWQLWDAAKQIWHLKQSLLYLIGERRLLLIRFHYSISDHIQGISYSGTPSTRL
jgi:MFS-type transporter involved in bile tolerance (Atg22 family)